MKVESRNIFSAKYKCFRNKYHEFYHENLKQHIEKKWKVRQNILGCETSKVCELNCHQRASNYQMVVRQSLANRQSLSTFYKKFTKKFNLSWLISKVCAYWFSLISMGMSRFKLIANQTSSVYKVYSQVAPKLPPKLPKT